MCRSSSTRKAALLFDGAGHIEIGYRFLVKTEKLSGDPIIVFAEKGCGFGDAAGSAFKLEMRLHHDYVAGLGMIHHLEELALGEMLVLLQHVLSGLHHSRRNSGGLQLPHR